MKHWYFVASYEEGGQRHGPTSDNPCLLPPTIVIDDAKYDESRLQGSEIPDHDSLLTVLENAIATLSPPALPQIQSSPTQTLLLPLPQQTEVQARTAIRKVTYVIHKF